MGCSKNYAFKIFRFCQNFTAIHQYSSSTTLWGVPYSIIVGFGYGDKVGVVECYFIIPYATPHRMILLLYAPQTNPDSQRRTAPTLELLSSAVSSVDVTSPIQRSQHRKQFWRRVDHKKTCSIKLKNKNRMAKIEQHKTILIGLVGWAAILSVGSCLKLSNIAFSSRFNV